MAKRNTETKAPKAPNVFAAAASAAPIVVQAKKAKKPGRPEKELSANTAATLDRLSVVDAAVKALKAEDEVLRGELATWARAEFVEDGAEKGERPENFIAIGKTSTASVELRQRSSASALSDEEASILEANGVPFEEVVTVDIPQRFVFNPAVLEDQKLMQKISDALNGVPELRGLEVVQVQQAQRASKRVVNTDTLDAVFKKQPGEMAALLPLVTTIAFKPKVNDTDALTRALDALGKEIQQ